MLKDLFDRLPWPPEYTWAAIGAFGAIIVLYAAIRIWRRRRRKVVPPPIPLTIDAAALGNEGPPVGGPRLELYHLPVRLAAVVIAPTGRTVPPLLNHVA